MNRTRSNGSRVGAITRAEDLLASPSEQEAVQLSQEPREGQLHRLNTATSLHPRPSLGYAYLTLIAFAPANERTALGYIRTSQAFAITGVVIAQVMRLNGDEQPGPDLGFFDVSIPLAIVFYVTAMMVAVVGAIRFYHFQHEMARGFGIKGGWELTLIMILSLSLLVALLILVLVISTEDS